MPIPSTVAGRWPTTVKVQCRNEDLFEAIIRFHPVPRIGLVPFINCPHCGREYSLGPTGEWTADRPLKILG